MVWGEEKNSNNWPKTQWAAVEVAHEKIGEVEDCVVVVTIGELYLSPIGLSLVTKVAPPRLVSTMMGVWFLSSFFGNYLSGFLGTFYDRMPKENFFLVLCSISVTTGVAIWAFNKPLKRALGSEGKAAA